MKSLRNCLLAALSSALLLVTVPVQAQNQVVSENGVIYQSPTRPQVFKESNALSGGATQGATQRWANDRDAERDRAERDHADRDRRDRERRDNRDGSVIIGNTYPPGTNTIILPIYPGYPSYQGYAPYPNYNVPVYPYGSSVTVSTPGYNDGTFNVFPWTSTVTTYGTAPVAPNYYGYRHYPSYPSCPPGYSAYPNYPSYPAPYLQGYRGAATPGYVFNGGSFPSGAYITGSTNGYSSGFSAGYSNGRTSVTIGTRR